MIVVKPLSKLIFSILSISKVCLCWNLPPTQFLSQFGAKNDRTHLSMLVPIGINQETMKIFRQLTREDEHDLTMPVSFKFITEVDQNMSLSKDPQDLIVFVPDDSEIDDHIEKFIGWFNQRKRTNKEFWLFDITSLGTIKMAKERLNKLKLDLDDDLYWFSNSKEGIIIYEAYRIHKDYDITVKKYGFWSNDKGLTVPISGKWIRRQNMERAKLKVMTIPAKPFTTEMPETGVPGEFEMKGMFPDVFFALQYVLNFTYVVTKPPDGQWGAIQSDGSWSGMVKELQEGRVDIATHFTVTKARSNVITFAQPITEVYHALFIKNPLGTFNFKAYFETLKYMSWLFVGLFCILAPTSLFATARLGNEPMKYEFTWAKSQVFVLCALTMRGWSVSPNQFSSRIAFIVILLAGIVIYYHWEAMLISYLSTRFIALPFTNIRGLVENSDFRIALIKGTSFDDSFKMSTDPIWQKAYSERIEPFFEEFAPFYESMDKLAELALKDESVAIYHPFGSGSVYPRYKSCELVMIPAKYDFKPFAYGFQKDSPYLGLFNHFLKEMREKGVLKQILNKYETGTQVCPDESGKPLGFESCFTAFLALLSGMALGFVIFLLENMNRIGNFNLPIFDAYDRRRDFDN